MIDSAAGTIFDRELLQFGGSFIIYSMMHRWYVVLVCAVVVIVYEAEKSSATAGMVKEHQVTAGRDTPLAWPPGLKEGRRRRAAESGKYKFAVIVEAGSSSTRVRVYKWPTPVGGARVAVQVPNIQQILEEKNKTKLSEIADDRKKVSGVIRTLLRYAATAVPKQQQSTSPVYIFATAG